jgi:hypothetical protein
MGRPRWGGFFESTLAKIQRIEEEKNARLRDRVALLEDRADLVRRANEASAASGGAVDVSGELNGAAGGEASSGGGVPKELLIGGAILAVILLVRR